MAYETIQVTPIGGSIGAEIAGVDLARPLSNRQAQEVHDAFLEHSVVFFRDQRLYPEQQKRAARLFGEPVAIPFVKSLDGHPEIIDIVKEAEDAGKYNFGGNWHTDTTFLETRRSAHCCTPCRSRRAAATPCSPICTPPTRPCRTACAGCSTG